MSDDGLVYGMGLDALVEPDFPRLTLDEVDDVLREIPALRGAAEIAWHSPRPLSATARVRTTTGLEVIVKRVPGKLRGIEALAEEHGFVEHLHSSVVPVSMPYQDPVARTGYVYEVQRIGEGEDLYRGTFSWSPYLSLSHANAAGRMLAALHLASLGYDAPRRPARPLLGRFTVFASNDPIAAIEEITVERPALGDFLAARNWQDDIARVHLDSHHSFLAHSSDLEPLWTHNDWHGTNLLWTGDDVSCVIDFGLADRTTAIHDVAIAVERFAVDWISIRDGGPANIQVEQVEAFMAGYESVRVLTAAERRTLPDLFPLVHAEYELSEIDYFLSCLPEPGVKNAEIAYQDYFLGHTEWTKTEEGQALLGLLRA
jgi:Ser/Thr protein kinase RdoA (MazF antagonist)